MRAQGVPEHDSISGQHGASSIRQYYARDMYVRAVIRRSDALLRNTRVLRMLFIPKARNARFLGKDAVCATAMSDITKRIEKAERTLQKGKPEVAVEEYLSILDDDPGNEAVCHTTADLCVSLGRNSEAVRLLGDLFDRQYAASEKARAAVTYKKLARIGKPSGDQSLRFAEGLAKNAKDALKAYQAALQTFLAKNRHSEAMTALRGIVRLEPSIENYCQLGEVAAEAGDAATAAQAYVSAGDLETDEPAKIALYERACKLVPENIEPALKCAQGYLSQGRAASAVALLKPFVTAQCEWAVKTLYGNALLMSGQAQEAAPLVWDSYERDSSHAPAVAEVIELLVRANHVHAALEWSRKLERKELSAGRRRDFVMLMKGISDRLAPNVAFLEYMAEVFNLANREHDYCETLLKLFDLFYASGNFRSAAECLDRAVEVDAYEPGHQSRLEMLGGKIAIRQYQAIAERLGTVLGTSPGAPAAPKVDVESESTALDDLMVQAQIYLRYSMQGKAREKLARIQALYPGQEANSAELRELYALAGMQAQPFNPASKPRTVTPPETQQSETSALPARNVAGSGTDEIGRISAITRNLYRQNSVNAVLFAAVNDLGRHWNASRCLAMLCTPGKPPSIAMEYCAPGLRQSDIHSIVKLVGLLQPLAVAHGTLDISAPRKTKPMLKPLRKSLGAMGIESLLAVPLLDGDEHTGLIVLTECDTVREWSDTDAELLRTMAEQVVLAVHNVRLRRLVKDLAVTEEKSGLVKRSSYMDVVLAEVSRGQRQDSPVSVMLMKMGTHEELTEQIGSAGLEAMMRHTAQLVTSNVRQNDIAVRYDPTTIAVILADTAEPNAVQAAEKLRRVAAVAALPGQDNSRISIGVAQALMNKAFDPGDLVTELVNRADRALEKSISAGAKTQALAAPLEYGAASA